MAVERKVKGWFYRNGHRIPIFEKREKDLAEGTYQGKTVQRGSEVDMPGGKGSVERIYQTSNPDLLYKNRIRVKNKETGDEIDMANGQELNPKFGKYGLRKPIDPKAIKARDRKSRNEILDYDHDAAKAWEGLAQVATPREVANDMGKRVRTGDGKIVRPVKRTGIDLETRVNNYAAEVAERELNTPSQTFASASKRFKDKAAAEGRTVYEVNSEGNISGVIKPSGRGGTGGVGGRSPRPGIRYTAGKNRGEEALRKNALDPRGKRGNGIRLPQERALADKKPGESYIKYIMEERGLSRADAIKFIMDKRKK